MQSSLPFRLAVLHKGAIQMLTAILCAGMVNTAIPFNGIFYPYLYVSGPLVYGIARYLQSYSTRLLSLQELMTFWNFIPGAICLLLGGLQWWLIGNGLAYLQSKRSSHPSDPTSSPVTSHAKQATRNP